MLDAYAVIAAAVVQDLVPRLPNHDFFWPNDGRLDVSTQTKPYVEVDIRVDFSKQASLEDKPIIQRHGDVVFYAYEKSGSGSASVREALRACASVFELAEVSGIQFEASDEDVPTSRPGWYGRALLVPFYYQESRD